MMFKPRTYKERRQSLKQKFDNGILLFLGNHNSPINYLDNIYQFRQDSTFLYFFGPNLPNLAGLIDVDSGKEYIFAQEPSVEDLIFSGKTPGLEDLRVCSRTDKALPLDQLKPILQKASGSGRKIRFLPSHRGETKLWLYDLLGINPLETNKHVSESFIQEVVYLREIKTEEEIRQIESAVDLSGDMILENMKQVKQGQTEQFAASCARHVAESKTATAFPIILTTNGQYLHVAPRPSALINGRLLIQDCGAESSRHYAGDITRTFPVSKKFSTAQKEIYEVVMAAQDLGIASSAPGIEFRSVHRTVAHYICQALTDIGIMKGDPAEAEAAGAHALFFPCGLGHAIGLDVHDMEGLGEDYVGYTKDIKRSLQFGINRLRLAKALKPGMVITIEPGIYFIPELIEQWRQNSVNADFINYKNLKAFSDFGGVRLEDDVLIVENGSRILGRPIPRTIGEVEETMA